MTINKLMDLRENSFRGRWLVVFGVCVIALLIPFGGGASPEPLDDFSPEEQSLRVELAAAYRLIAEFGWDNLIYNHISVAVPSENGEEQHFLINPFGLGYDEITASSLVKIDLQGNVVHPGFSPVEKLIGKTNYAGFIIHSAVHEARPDDAVCVLHTHHPETVAVSAMKSGMVNVGQSYYMIGDIAYHDYEGLAIHDEEKATLVSDLGDRNVMLMRNHGLLTVGKSVGACWTRMYYAHRASEVQVAALAGANDLDSIHLPNDEIIQRTRKEITAFSKVTMGEEFGSLEFSALMRRLDRKDASYRD